MGKNNGRHNTMADFWKRVEIKEGACWVWRGTVSSVGRSVRYGVMRKDSRKQYAHRLAYTDKKGPIPVGMQLDHLCRNTLCVNPDHLEAVPSKVNTLRGVGPTAQNATKTKCPMGHEYDWRTRRSDGRQYRACGQCQRSLRRGERAVGEKGQGR